MPKTPTLQEHDCENNVESNMCKPYCKICKKAMEKTLQEQLIEEFREEYEGLPLEHWADGFVALVSKAEKIFELSDKKSNLTQLLKEKFSKLLKVERGECEHCYCMNTTVLSPSEATTYATEVRIPHLQCCNCRHKKNVLETLTSKEDE